MKSNFHPDWISAPGDTIADMLEERSLTVEVFASTMGEPIDRIRDLLDGTVPITIGVAQRLRDTIGASVSFWMARDAQFRDDASRLSAKQWLDDLPTQDMLRFGWIGAEKRDEQRLSACLAFFGVGNIDEWKASYSPLLKSTAFRNSKSFESLPTAVVAWLRRGEQLTESIPCAPWNKAKFEELLPELRRLSRERDPAIFVPELQAACAACGVAVSIVRTPKGCRASGATRFLAPDRAMLLLSARYRTDDQLWFSFFHEAAHLILHGDRLFLEFSNPARTVEEREANDYAARVLVPKAHQKELLGLPHRGREIMRFARRVGVSPGVIVGQLQHYERISFSRMNHLKRRYAWAD